MHQQRGKGKEPIWRSSCWRRPHRKLRCVSSPSLSHPLTSHPTQVSDGTKTVLVLAGELLKNAEHLLIMGLHPREIGKGYTQACVKALKELESTFFFSLCFYFSPLPSFLPRPPFLLQEPTNANA